MLVAMKFTTTHGDGRLTLKCHIPDLYLAFEKLGCFIYLISAADCQTNNQTALHAAC